MLSWSDRQGSIATASGRLDMCTVERDLPPNMRKIGDSTELAYRAHNYISNVKLSREGEGIMDAPCSFAFQRQPDPLLIEPRLRDSLHLK